MVVHRVLPLSAGRAYSRPAFPISGRDFNKLSPDPVDLRMQLCAVAEFAMALPAASSHGRSACTKARRSRAGARHLSPGSGTHAGGC